MMLFLLALSALYIAGIVACCIVKGVIVGLLIFIFSLLLLVLVEVLILILYKFISIKNIHRRERL